MTNRNKLLRGSFYRVCEGDTLSEIIDRFLPGHWALWIGCVRDLNRMRHGDLIHPGQIVQLPEVARDPPAL